jgi:hypothetical protein
MRIGIQQPFDNECMPEIQAWQRPQRGSALSFLP